jgi:chemotaxis protein histidine kinase CheA
MDRPNQALISGNAYKIFVGELDRHLAQALAVLGQDQTAVPDEELKVIGRNFHTVRGAAGFFGFEALSTAAKEIETWALKSAAPLSEKLESIRALLLKIQALTRQLPPARV